MSKHIAEDDLALYATHDLGWWREPLIRVHIARCAACRSLVEEFRSDREMVRIGAEQMPEGVNWNRLAAEMTANIRVGLAAGECVAPRIRRRGLPVGWRVAAAVGGVSFLLILGWWLNMPASETAALGRTFKAIANARTGGRFFQEPGPLVEASTAGIELRENGSALGVSQRGVRPVSVTLNVQGSARARYIDSDTGQVTITSVYAQ